MWKQHVQKFQKYYIASGLAILIVGISGFVFADSISAQYKKIFSKTALESSLGIIGNIKIQDLTKSHCSVILQDSLENYTTESGLTRKMLSEYRDYCQSRYDIAFLEQDISLCKRVIAGKKQDFANEFLVLSGFDTVKNSCINKYLTVSFTGGTLFDVQNDFKSEIIVNFGLPFYYDIGDPNSKEFIDHRIEAKKRLLSLLDISPKVDVNIDDITLYSKQARISLNLLPKTSYTFSLKEFDSELKGEKMKSEAFTLLTQDFQYFGLKRTDGVTLVPDVFPSEFELLSFNSDIKNTQVKICRIPNESYAKIEALESTKGLPESVKKFFIEGIDILETYDCQTKDISFTQNDTQKSLIKKQIFNLTKEIGNPARSGLYYVTFVKKEDRNRYEKVQKALFMGVIDSHITMKLSKNGKAFFFVNDFSGKPLSGQKIRVYSNEFQEKNTQYLYENGKYVEKSEYFSPLDRNIFTSGALLGTTNEQGILEVDMKGKVKDFFEKTLDSGNYIDDGNFNSFFVTASSDTNLSYVSSKWNGGITPWNFGYTLDSGWWYGEIQDRDMLSLDAWGDTPNYFGHSFTERKLYLPGEQVYYKAVIRNAGTLTIPEGKKFQLLVQDSQGKEIFKKQVQISDQGSISETFFLGNDASLGAYTIYLQEGEKTTLFTGFSVEVFQNPKFKNEVMLEVSGLEKEVVDIKNTQIELSDWGYEQEKYSGKFDITATITSKYYSGNPVSKGTLNYKVYRQAYYDDAYWADCFYGCYWEPEKEFYTEGTGSLDAAGMTQIQIPIAFESYYDDYKYIVEATVVDTAGDTISGANSLIARLPNAYKTWNPQSRVQFSTEKRFYKQAEKLEITGKLSVGKFSKIYENQDILIIKKKEYYTDYVSDVKGFKRPKTRIQEVLQDVLLVNTQNFDISRDGTLTLKYPLKETGEYVFEYGKINPGILKMPNGKTPLQNAQLVVEKFQETKAQNIYLPSQKFSVYDNTEITSFLVETCDIGETVCNYTNIESTLLCQKYKNKYISDEVQIQNLCANKTGSLSFSQKISVDMLIQSYDKNYFSLVSYGGESANNPIISDNKISVLTEKMVYKVGDTARVLVRLPFSKGKILWTEEKNEVIRSEYIDVPGNIFFKEIPVTDAHLPNTYISVLAIPTDFSCPQDATQLCVPEYKVGYSEIVGDKSEKKSEITIKADKQKYMPREIVKLDIQSNKKEATEFTVMVVDDSLIALMGNIDTNILEKIYQKLPFQIQTSISNIAMLANYYFSRQGIVGGSGNKNLKGGDSAVSSRMIFKNTAYYNATLLSDTNGKAQVSFTLPDNLTNFRVMVVSQSKTNFFGYTQSFLEVRKDVLLEPRVPQMLRNGDRVELGANIFNSTKDELSFDVSLSAEGLSISEAQKKIKVKAGESSYVTWTANVTGECDVSDLGDSCQRSFTMQALGGNAERSDSYKGTYKIAQDPLIYQNILAAANINPGQTSNLDLKKSENTNSKKSLYQLSLSNTPLAGIEKNYESLLRYPWGCVEQLLSSTLPNAILQRFVNLKEVIKIEPKEIENNLKNGYAQIMELQNTDGGFKYWKNDFTSDIEITPHVLRNLVELKNAGFAVEDDKLLKVVNYLSLSARENTPVHTRLEALWAVAKYMPQKEAEVLTKFNLKDITSLRPQALSNHELLSYSYTLYYLNAEKYKSEIAKNIEILQAQELPIQNELYYSYIEDRAILAQLMIDVGMKQSELSEVILEIYKKDWASYWYSTKQKNAAFLAFVKYMERYGTQYKNEATLSFGSNSSKVSLDSKLGNYSLEKKLSELLSGDMVSLNITNTQGPATIFAQNNIRVSPIDPLKVPAYSNKITTNRVIYEVVDESKVADVCDWSGPNNGCQQGTGLTLHSGDTFKKGTLYKIVLKANFESQDQRNNLTLEDYIPAGFSVINANFLTNSAGIRQEGTQNNWEWNQTQIRPEVVMANAKYSWGDTAEYSYFVRADYVGEFLYAPLAAYLMYEPTVRGNTGFRRIVIK